MALLVHAGEAMALQWRSALRALDTTLDVRIYPEIGAADQVEGLLTFKPPPGLVSQLPRLKLLQCSGAGVDQLLEGAAIPPGVAVARIAEQPQADDLAVFVLAVTLAWFRRLDAYHQQQAEARWARIFPHPTVTQLSVGVLGLGFFGRTIARRFADCGFRVHGWSRSVADLPGVSSWVGRAGLLQMAERCNVLICALPLTSETRGILSRPLLERTVRPGFLVNLGRGGHLIEADLAALLEEGSLDGAALDVHAQEPLPEAHPFWRHPRIRITPHVGAFATPEQAAPLILENLHRARRGEPPLHRVVPARGY